MNERLKKLLILGGFIASVIVLAFALYFTFFRAAPPAPSVNPPSGRADDDSGGVLPSALEGLSDRIPSGQISPDQALPEADTVAQGGVTQTNALTTSPVANITPNAAGGANYYDPQDGRFYTITNEGEVAQLSSKAFPNAENVTWNRDSQKAIIEFPDGSNVVYNFTTQEQVTLPKHWEDFDFSPTQDEIAAKSLALDPNNRWIVITSDDGSRTETIQALGENADKVDINWSPNDQVIAFADTASPLAGGLDRKMILPIGKNSENFKGLVVEGLNFEGQWSDDGQRLLYSVSGSYSDYKPLLWIVDATSNTMGDNRRSLGLNTWAEKCTFSSGTTAYCAVPQSIGVNVGLQPRLAARTPDSLYRIDLQTGQSALIAIPEEDTTMQNLVVGADGNTLYYTNANTGVLEAINLR